MTTEYNRKVSASRLPPSRSTFPPQVARVLRVDKTEHGRLLTEAMAAKRMGRQVVADATGVRVRTVTNWTSGSTMPSEVERLALRRLLGDDYDRPGDAVER